MTADLRLLATVNRALSKVPEVTLDPQEIERFVEKREGPVPGDHWRPAYRALCHDLATSARLNPIGRIMANGQLVGLLKARCQAERLLARHPAVRGERIERPIIIMGPMRSGTTRLQRLLACDPRLAWTRFLESLFPVPSRGRVAAAAAVHTALRSLNPAVQRLHPTGPRRPDEELGYLSMSFHSAQFAVQWDVPGVVELERHRDLLPVAQELRTMLQLNGWARGGVGERRWLLKCPAYTGMADALLTVFPDAQLICLHRDPAKVVGSSASLVWQQRRMHSDHADRHRIGSEWLARTAERQRLLATARAGHPQVSAFDLDYDEISGDWRAAMRRLYRFVGLPLTDEVLAAMTRYMDRARAHRGHDYRLADFGVSEAQLRSAFGAEPRSAAPVLAPVAVPAAAAS